MDSKIDAEVWIDANTLDIRSLKVLVDFTRKILNINDEEIMVEQTMVLTPDNRPIIEDGMPKMVGGRVLTLGLACVTALQNNYQDEQNLTPEKKMFRFMTAVKIHNQSLPVEMTIEELSEIKLTLNKQYGTLVYARASTLLENSNNPSTMKG